MLPSSPVEQISRTLSDLEKRIERLERLDQVFTINPAETVINEAGIDRNLRIEGDTEPNLVFVDAGIDRVGIGTNAPGGRLHVLWNTFPVHVTENSDAGINNSPQAFALRHTTSNIPVLGFGVIQVFQMHDNANVVRTGAFIQCAWIDPATGSYDARLDFLVARNSVHQNRLRLRESLIQFNVNNEDMDVYFETSGSAVTLFVDGGNDNVGMGTGAPNASAKLEISSTTGSLLIPRMTTAQRNALGAVNGMGIYNTTTNQFEKYQAGAWAAW